jgi:hypothetical protein
VPGGRAGIKNVIELAYRIGLPKDAKHVLQPIRRRPSAHPR